MVLHHNNSDTLSKMQIVFQNLLVVNTRTYQADIYLIRIDTYLKRSTWPTVEDCVIKNENFSVGRSITTLQEGTVSLAQMTRLLQTKQLFFLTEISSIANMGLAVMVCINIARTRHVTCVQPFMWVFWESVEDLWQISSIANMGLAVMVCINIARTGHVTCVQPFMWVFWESVEDLRLLGL